MRARAVRAEEEEHGELFVTLKRLNAAAYFARVTVYYFLYCWDFVWGIRRTWELFGAGWVL